MSRETEFKALNTRVFDGSASDEERQRWQSLRDELQAAKLGDDENRRHPRSPVSIDVSFQSDSELIRAVSADLGAGGLCLALDGTFEVDSEHRLELTLPGASSATAVEARVAWATGGHVGFEFLDVPDALNDRLSALVWEEVDLSDI